MYKQNELLKLGDKYYLLSDIQKIFDDRIKSIPLDEIIMEEQ